MGKRILKSEKHNPQKTYKSFMNKVANAFHLYGRVFTQKFSKNDNRLIRAQYITYLVSCSENFFRELFIEMFNKKMLNRERIFKIKKIKQLNFNFSDLHEMEEKNISVAEVLVSYMNFQNMKDIFEFTKAIEFNKYSQKVKKSLKPNKKNDENIKTILTAISEQKNKNLDNLKVSKAINKLIVEFMTNDKILLGLYSADKCFNTIRKMVELRHEIVHRTKEVKIEHWEIWAYTIATVQFANLFHRIYEIKVKELKKDKKI